MFIFGSLGSVYGDLKIYNIKKTLDLNWQGTKLESLSVLDSFIGSWSKNSFFIINNNGMNVTNVLATNSKKIIYNNDYFFIQEI